MSATKTSNVCHGYVLTCGFTYSKLCDRLQMDGGLLNLLHTANHVINLSIQYYPDSFCAHIQVITASYPIHKKLQ